MAEQSTHETSSAPVAVRGAFTLFGDAWQLYGKHLKSILLFQLVLLLLSLGIGLLFVLLFAGGASAFLPAFQRAGEGSLGVFFGGAGVVALLLIVFSVLFSVWIAASQLVYFNGIVHGTPQAFRPVFREGWNRLFGLLWIGILQSVVVGVGFLLLIVPGIIWMLRLSQAQFLFLTENVRGRDALKRSWELTRGISWLVLARYYVFGVIAALLGILQLIPLVGPLLIAPFVVTPLLILWSWLFVGELVQLKKAYPTYVAPYSAGKKAALVLPAFGFAALFVGFLALSVFSSDLSSQTDASSFDDYSTFDDADFPFDDEGLQDDGEDA